MVKTTSNLSNDDGQPVTGKYHRAAALLRKRIMAGDWAPGEQLPPMSELVPTLGVSHPTAQRAITKLTEDGFLRTQHRVGVYVAPTLPCNNRFVLVLPRLNESLGERIADRFYANMSQAASATLALEDSDHHIEPWGIPEGAEHNKLNKKIERLFRQIADDRVAGIIYVGGTRPMMDDKSIRSSGIPQVIISSVDSEYPTVLLDHSALWKKAVKRLCDHGCQRIAAIGMSPGVYPRDIEETYQIPTKWAVPVDMNHPQTAIGLAQLLFSAGPGLRPDGLVITDDNLTEYVMAGVLASGIDVPRDLKIISHANFPDTPPRLLPVEYLGYNAYQLIGAATNLCERIQKLKGQRRSKTSESMQEIVEPQFE